KPLSPGVPAILSWEPLRIEPVKLPPEGYQPGLRPFVLADQLRLAEKQIVTARGAVAAASKQLADAEARAKTAIAPPTSVGRISNPSDKRPDAQLKPLFTDDFSSAQPDAWEKRGGDWAYEGGRLIQRQDGDTRAALRWKKSPPADFQARFKFTP